MRNAPLFMPPAPHAHPRSPMPIAQFVAARRRRPPRRQIAEGDLRPTRRRPAAPARAPTAARAARAARCPAASGRRRVEVDGWERRGQQLARRSRAPRPRGAHALVRAGDQVHDLAQRGAERHRSTRDQIAHRLAHHRQRQSRHKTCGRRGRRRRRSRGHRRRRPRRCFRRHHHRARRLLRRLRARPRLPRRVIGIHLRLT